MNAIDFIGLTPGEAGVIYRAHLEAGYAKIASHLHKSYFVVHRIRLQDDQKAPALCDPTLKTIE